MTRPLRWIKYIPIKGRPQAFLYRVGQVGVRDPGAPFKSSRSPRYLERTYCGPVAIVREKATPVAFEPWDKRGAL
jgi:hypothetical protein